MKQRLIYILLLLISISPLAGTALYGQAGQYQTNPDSVVRVAYRTQTKDQVTGAVSEISGAEIRKIQSATLTSALSGKLAGVNITDVPGAPGFDEPGITVRGYHTMVNNSPLLLVDGIQVNNISFLSPDEIESVSVLKDAAALALYGVRGGNGVLLVTTRRGQVRSKNQITLNARYGLQSATRLPEMAGSYDFARLYNEALGNDGLPALYTDKQLEGYRLGSDPYLYPDVNWMDETLRPAAPIQDYSLTFDGGNETAKYFVMLGFVNNQGLYAHTDQKTNSNINYNGLNFCANLDVNITKSLLVQAGLGGNIQDRKFPPVGTESLWRNMLTYAPNLYPVRTPDGQLTGTANFPANPVGDLLEKGYQSRHDRNVQMNIRATQQLDFITPGLKIYGALLFDNLLRNRYDKTRSYAYFEPILGQDANGGDSLYYMQRGLSTDLTVSTGGDYENNRLIMQGGLDYSRRSGLHEFQTMMFYQQDRYIVLGNQSPFAMQNLAARLNYGYRDRYYLEGVVSYSGIENYAPGNRFGFFPALSLGWLLHKENFLRNQHWVDYLKLRLSAGRAGNDKGASRFSYNQYWGVAGSQGAYFGTGQSWYNGLVQLALANPEITWERADIYNFGLDADFFGRLSLTADVFAENRSHILVNASNLSSALGGYTSGQMVNKGQVLNYGTELTATYNGGSGDLKYHIGGQFSYTYNKIKESGETPKKEAYSYRQGHPVGQYFGLEAIGFFRDESEIQSSPQQTFSLVRPGDLKYRDQNNDGIIDVNDEIAIGHQEYPRIHYGINTGLLYKGVNLDLFFQGIANNSVYLNGYLFQPFLNNANIIKWAAEGHWTAENHAEATFPRLTTQASANNYRPSTFWVRDADFLRLRHVELGYTFPEHLASGLGFEYLKVYASGVNLITWDDLAVDVDPTTLSMGYPLLRSFSLGVQVKF